MIPFFDALPNNTDYPKGTSCATSTRERALTKILGKKSDIHVKLHLCGSHASVEVSHNLLHAHNGGWRGLKDNLVSTALNRGKVPPPATCQLLRWTIIYKNVIARS